MTPLIILVGLGTVITGVIGIYLLLQRKTDDEIIFYYQSYKTLKEAEKDNLDNLDITLEDFTNKTQKYLDAKENIVEYDRINARYTYYLRKMIRRNLPIC